MTQEPIGPATSSVTKYTLPPEQLREIIGLNLIDTELQEPVRIQVAESIVQHTKIGQPPSDDISISDAHLRKILRQQLEGRDLDNMQHIIDQIVASTRTHSVLREETEKATALLQSHEPEFAIKMADSIKSEREKIRPSLGPGFL